MPLHPLAAVPDGMPRLALLVLLLAGTAFAGKITRARALRTPSAPKGAISLQLARTPARATSIVSEWRSLGRIGEARRHLRNDYLFILFYANLVALACVWAGTGAGWARTGNALAWVAWLVGVLDVLENLAMGHMIGGPTSSPWPQLTFAASAPKWILALVCNLFWLVAVGRLLLRRP